MKPAPPDLSAFSAVVPHSHHFDGGNPAGERGTQRVLILTTVMMVIEIAGGYAFNSMALLADGWHMSSHALAIGLNALAYVAARRLAGDARYSFGTWKIEVLAGFASALVLLAVAANMVWESVVRLWQPAAIDYQASLVLASVGLLVNVASAWLLHQAGGHEDHVHGAACHAEHSHAHAHAHGDLNLRSAYLHVLADALTSVLAMVALALGMALGWSWSDAAVGVLGGVLVALWAGGLIRHSAQVLLDREMDHPLVHQVKASLTQTPGWSGTTVLADLHLWRVGRQRWACIVSVVSSLPTLNAAVVRAQLAQHPEIAHLTVEVHHVLDAPAPTENSAAPPTA